MQVNHSTAGLFAPEKAQNVAFHTLQAGLAPPSPELVHAIADFMRQHQVIESLQIVPEGSGAISIATDFGRGVSTAEKIQLSIKAREFFDSHPRLARYGLLITRSRDCLLHITYAQEEAV